MILCNYITDIGIEFKRINPFIQGLDTVNNVFIPSAQVLSQISNYVPIDGYFEVENNAGICPLPKVIRRRKLVIQDNSFIYELDYYEPFFNLDFTTADQLEIKVETIGEQLQDYFLRLKL